MIKNIVENNKNIDINKNKIDKLKDLFPNCFNSNERVVFSLGFLKEYRGLGYAKRVRNIVKKHLHDLGVTTLVGYVRKDNVSSIGSLEKVGATFIPVDNDYYQVEHDIQNLNLK